MTAKVRTLILLVISVQPLPPLTHATHSQQCGEKYLIGHHGILTSPNYPQQYPEKINCSWLLKVSNTTISNIVITNLDFECKVKQDCCKNNALVISNDFTIYKKLCGEKRETLLIRLTSESETAVRISFTTTKNTRKRKGFRLIFSIRNKTLCEGYDLSCLDERSCYNSSDICDSHYQCPDHSDEINCAKCANQATCNNHSDFCFDPHEGRCDGIWQCPDGEDELDCPEICPGKTPCRNGWGCYSQNQICDGHSECSDNSDEVDCTKRLCGKEEYFLCNNRKCIHPQLVGNGINDCGDYSDELRKTTISLVTLVIFSAFSLSMFFFLLICRWCSTRRDIRRLMQDFPQFPLPPFRGPGEINRVECSIQFSESDFLHGGEIYEAFVRSRRRLVPETGRHVTSLIIPQGEQRLFTNCIPSCAAVALASLGISQNSCFVSKNETLGECGISCDYCQERGEFKGLSDSTTTSEDRKCLDLGEKRNEDVMAHPSSTCKKKE